MHWTALSRRFSPLLLVPLLTAGLLLAGCDDSGSVTGPGDGDDPDGVDEIEVPDAYTFDSRFEDGESAVAYPGQVTRNLLIADLKILTDGRADGAVTLDRLMDRYEYDSQDLDILLSTDPPPRQQRYNDIVTGKSLKGKATASYSDEALIGVDALAGFNSGATADDVITTYLQDIAANYADGQSAPEAYTTTENVSMSQIVNKLLLGAVAYAQGTAKYLDDVLNTDDSPNTRDEDNPYSTLGHVWDEAFGYYGAAREFGSGEYYDENGMIANAVDRNGDTEIDLSAEYVHTWADYSVDRGVVNEAEFHEDAFEAFREGRTAILNQESIEDIRDHAADARAVWDRVVAANVVHYLNSMEGDLSELSDSETITEENLGPEATAEFNEHWGEAKPFAWALQYNPDRQVTDQQLENLHAELGGAPPYGQTKSDAVAAIDAAKDILETAYDFDDDNMANW